MPATNRAGLSGTEYLKAQPPSWESLRTGLAIFALFIIVRYCVRQVYSWLRPVERLNPIHPTTNHLFQPRYQPHLWPMDEKSPQGGNARGMNSQDASFSEEGRRTTAMIPTDPRWRTAGDSIPGHFISRLPSAPPLTPPKLSNAVFTFDGQSHSQESFIHQPNPDYISSTSTSFFQADSPKSSSIPRRRSYTRTLPMGSPISHTGQSSEAESPNTTLSPSSYPPTSGLLPPAPPSELDSEDDGKAQRNVDVQGEIISVLDRDGAGWSRHTRVYGGGACLACAASGGHGGGFYGATVTPEEMR